MVSKKTTKRLLPWQAVIMSVLLAAAAVSMFFPRIRISADMIVDMCRNVVEQAIDHSEEKSSIEKYLSDEVWDEAREKMNEEFENDFSLSGLDMIFLSEEKIVKKLIHVTGEDEDKDWEELDEEIDEALEDLTENSSGQEMMESVIAYFSYMKVGYLLLYIFAVILLALAIIWCVCGLDHFVFLLISMGVSVYGTAVTTIGTLDFGAHGKDMVAQLFDSAGVGGSVVTLIEDYIDFSKPAAKLWRAMNITFGGLGCMVICILLLLFSIYLLVSRQMTANVVPANIVPPAAVPVGSAVQIPPVQGSCDLSAGAAAIGKITVVRGECAGASAEIRDGEEIVIGRDPTVCHLVFSNNKISRKHCGIRYDSQRDVYLVKNYSMNGTSLLSGHKISSDVFVQVAAGNVIELAEGKEEIVLG